MKTVLNIAVMIALCANTALVAADKTTAENDARNLMSNIVSSFESGDTRSIEKMVKDEKFRGSLLDMIRHSPRPLFLRLEMDSMLMAEPFIVRVRCYAHRSLFPQRPVMADFKLEKCDGQYAVAGYWCRLEEEMARLYDVAFPACREMADSASRCDTNSVFRLFGADSVVDGGAKFREFLSKRGAEWVDDVMRKRLRVMYCDRMPAVPVDMTDAGMGVRAEFSVLKSDGTVADRHVLLFRNERFVGAFVPQENNPRTTTSFEYENKATIEDGVRKYILDLQRGVVTRDSAAVRRMIKDERILQTWLGEIKNGKAPDFRLEFDSLVSLSPLIVRARMLVGEAREPLLVEMQLEMTDGKYEMVGLAARQSDEEMFDVYRTSEASSRTPLPAAAPFAPDAKVSLEDDIRNFVSMFCSSVKSRDVETVKSLVVGEESQRLIIKEMERLKIRFYKLEYDSVLSLSPLVVRARFYESARSRTSTLIEMELERAVGRYAILKVWSDQVARQNLAVERALLESRKLVLYVNRCDTNAIVQLFGVTHGGDRNLRFRDFMRKRGVEWIDDVMRENRRIDGGSVNVLRDGEAVTGMRVIFKELSSDKSVRCEHDILYRDGCFIGKHTSER